MYIFKDIKYSKYNMYFKYIINRQHIYYTYAECTDNDIGRYTFIFVLLPMYIINLCYINIIYE